jgi:hypothetical protein
LHEPTSWPDPLPKKYWDYSSKWDEDHLMSEGCYNFIINAMSECLKCEMTRSHAIKILLGLISHIMPNGTVVSSYLLPDNIESRAAILYQHAKRTVEKHASFDELYRSYARPGQWEKHKIWFADNLNKLDWNKFFTDTKCLNGNFFQRLRQKLTIKNEIKKLSLRVAC